ncbi:phytanoyl-CoA dioxygenase family protein [Mucilaginibacter lacusdianchii]|uniref:phytanoyl-CoA dioxygenase family protein n=1 Tax=Mucilaginibacter lacusdianchii TaxID=2684211 RepID=UPI00131ABECE|nr:phytanoyl-CoA dioxygenase family protein [Mucilaginibacter sp. JXJ CY 39]
MLDFQIHKENVRDNGFTVIPDVFSFEEVEALIAQIEAVDTSKATFRKTDDLFAIRQFFKEVPEIGPLVLTQKLQGIINTLFGDEFFVVKSIYFDKPEKSNWFVAYHQDLTISVNKKADVSGFGPWTVKQNQFAVQPPLTILQGNFTVRIHLDDTDETNGALKVIPQSHAKGIYRPETIDWSKEKEKVCSVSKGGIMIMRPLLLHASNRTVSAKRRRVIHVEFSNEELPRPLLWSERNRLS